MKTVVYTLPGETHKNVPVEWTAARGQEWVGEKLRAKGCRFCSDTSTVVPEGRLKIAQRFIAGEEIKRFSGVP